MKRASIIWLTAVTVMLTLLSGCYSTYLTSTWRSCEEIPHAFEKVGVAALIPTNTYRGIVEESMVRELGRYHVPAVTTAGILPPSSIPDAPFAEDDTATIQQLFREEITKSGIDAVLIISILDTRKEEHYTGGRTFHYVEPVYGGFGVPYVYPLREHRYVRYPYYRYYTYRHVAVYRPGYYYEASKYFVETSLFDAKSGHLLWSGQTTTVDPGDVRTESAIFAEVIVEGMMRDRAIRPK